MSFRCAKAVRAGRCQGAECCGIVPIEMELYERHKDAVLVTVSRTQDIADQFTLLYTDDGLCAFLDRDAISCSIYEERPRICRMYGKIKRLECPYLKRNGKLRHQRETDKILNRAGTDIQEVYKILKAEAHHDNTLYSDTDL